MSTQVATAMTATGAARWPRRSGVFEDSRSDLHHLGNLLFRGKTLSADVALRAPHGRAGRCQCIEYLEHLTIRGNRDAELRLLLNEITIGETYMFRHPAQLDALRNVILPQILEGKSSIGPKRLRFWCAGCSTGEEPHTLAMLLLEEKNKMLAGWTVDILATDLNDNSLEAARAGIYGEYALRNTTRSCGRSILTMRAKETCRPTICSNRRFALIA